ncbi:MAG: lactonase family protein [Hamadaea sp.]|uniref:lactonase family protein n=1 Tax=Hamadaea sp. TaxID=2024425 RepID=UPI0018120C93|nr:lactonase family protein [Hamadaea sp.]NUT22973.1 lactonase family protein [Hamadaea sp.]
MLIYVGAYTSTGGGIRCYEQDPSTGVLTEAHPPTTAVDPSFLAWDAARANLYAVSESTGGVEAFARSDHGLLTSLGQQWTGGTDPCHLVVDPTGRFLVTANYGTGSVSVHPIEADGSLGERRDLVEHGGSGPDAERQEGPHAHMIAYRPSGGSFYVTDLGTDQIHEYALSPDGAILPVRTIPAEAGSGPRHVAIHPTTGIVYVSAELDSSVLIYRPQGDGLTLTGKIAATAELPAERNYPSHIECSADGRFVYVGNRGADCVTVFEVTPDGLTPVIDVPAGGRWPRHFAVIGDFFYVANQYSGTVTAGRIDPATGVPDDLVVVAEVAEASCVLAG